MSTIIDNLRNKLTENSNEQLQKSSHHFFKEQISCYGIKSVKVAEIAKEYYNTIQNRTKSEIFDLCDELWKSGYLEESIVACNWSYAVRKYFEPADFWIFENWIDGYINNWASCDTFCNHTIGKFIDLFPAYISELKRWTQSKNRWMRRASAVSLIVPAPWGFFK